MNEYFTQPQRTMGICLLNSQIPFLLIKWIFLSLNLITKKSCHKYLLLEIVAPELQGIVKGLFSAIFEQERN